MRPVSALPSLSRELQRSLERSIEGALRYRSGSRARLRDVVRTVIDELRAAGATGERVRAVLAAAVDRHPATGRLDRTSLITGAHSSTVITELILTWVDDPDWSLAAAAPVPVRARDGWRPDERERLIKRAPGSQGALGMTTDFGRRSSIRTRGGV